VPVALVWPHKKLKINITHKDPKRNMIPLIYCSSKLGYLGGPTFFSKDRYRKMFNQIRQDRDTLTCRHREANVGVLIREANGTGISSKSLMENDGPFIDVHIYPLVNYLT